MERVESTTRIPREQGTDDMAENDKPQASQRPDQQDDPDMAQNAPGEAGEGYATSLESALQELQVRANEYRDEMLRARAEAENQRKRLERESATAVKYAAEKVFRDLLSVADSLELGLKAARDAGAGQGVIEGIELTRKQLHDALSRHGVTTVDPAGESFDPSLHEAMSMVPSDAVPANHVLEVVQKGYCLHERLLRPARVVVASAPPESPAAGG